MCSDYINDVHHDIGNGLMAIKGILYLIRRNHIREYAVLKEHLLGIETQADRIDKASRTCLMRHEEHCNG